MKSALNKIERAIALHWSPSLPRWCGPGTWLKTPKAERRELLRAVREKQARRLGVAMSTEGDT